MTTKTFDSVAFKAKRDAGIEQTSLWDATVFEITQSYAEGDADLRYADLSYANLSGANLSGANLRDADLSYANLSDANLSGAKGVLSAIDYMEQNFEATADGYIVYKTFNSQYTAPNSWVIETNSIINEIVNQLPTIDCACGVNVAPLEWVINADNGNESCDIWKCLIEWKWLAGVTVPYHTDGKIRAERVRLIEIVK